ncbi:hypothetical protein [Flagellimonas pacifica]|uniref:Uncharacterized protein n=1 Tax=Flagellimonas pacifica TaxID=1247520 RepID=A0A285MVL3_9FLAO|nr:hypothetical protein [Allomuricauda parva]SNZ01230.1 hypothetical protein SAMN06265377_3067 [Allomuricauda parva]
MSETEENIFDKFNELNERLGSVGTQEPVEISEESVVEFCRGFELFVLGSFHFIQDNTKSHQNIFVTASGDQIETFNELTKENFTEFANQQKQCTPPSSIDFTFNLSQSIYPISDLSETVNVYLKQQDYEIVYVYSADKEFRISKAYMTYIEPNEIRELRDLISQSIIKKVSAKIDELQ